MSHRRLAAASLASLWYLAGALALALAGCAEPVTYGERASASTVESYEGTSCSTGSVLALSAQIADEVDCMSPGSLVRFEPTAEVVVTGSAVLPYLHQGAKDDLFAAAQGRVVNLNSAFRTVVQQYLLYRWYRLGRCGIPIAATPGDSNHESGRAIDVDNYDALISALAAHGWAHDVPGDPVHFDHTSSPDIRGADILAFQRLWNRNHPEDPIGEDGAYGPMTEARIKLAPAEGFAKGGGCVAPPARSLAVASIMSPATLTSGERGHVTVTLTNNGQVGWRGTSQLVTADGQPSPLTDPATWLSPAAVTTLGADLAVGEQAAVDFDVLAPEVDAETTIDVTLTVVDGADRFGAIPFAVTVRPVAGGDGGDAGGGCGCATGGGGPRGGAGALGLALVVGLALARPRRR